MKNTKRALRRHHRQRMIALAMRSFIAWDEPEESRLQIILRWYNNMTKCSCFMCGHRRKWWGPTTQERRRLYQEAEELAWLYQREAAARSR